MGANKKTEEIPDVFYWKRMALTILLSFVAAILIYKLMLEGGYMSVKDNGSAFMLILCLAIQFMLGFTRGMHLLVFVQNVIWGRRLEEEKNRNKKY